MYWYGRRISAPQSALHKLLEPLHRHTLCSGPGVHVEPVEIFYVLVVYLAALAYEGHQSLLGPSPILFSYAVKLL